MQRASQLDPHNVIHFTNLGETYGALRRFPEAEVEYCRAAAQAPSDLYLASEMPLLAFSAKGSTREMDAWLEAQGSPTEDESILREIRVEWATMRGDWKTVIPLSESMETEDGESDWTAELDRNR